MEEKRPSFHTQANSKGSTRKQSQGDAIRKERGSPAFHAGLNSKTTKQVCDVSAGVCVVHFNVSIQKSSAKQPAPGSRVLRVFFFFFPARSSRFVPFAVPTTVFCGTPATTHPPSDSTTQQPRVRYNGNEKKKIGEQKIQKIISF